MMQRNKPLKKTIQKTWNRKQEMLKADTEAITSTSPST